MMTKEQIKEAINNTPKYQIIYTRKDGCRKVYTVAITERNPDCIVGYKYTDGESQGIRRFNFEGIEKILVCP